MLMGFVVPSAGSSFDFVFLHQVVLVTSDSLVTLVIGMGPLHILQFTLLVLTSREACGLSKEPLFSSPLLMLHLSHHF